MMVLPTSTLARHHRDLSLTPSAPENGSIPSRSKDFINKLSHFRSCRFLRLVRAYRPAGVVPERRFGRMGRNSWRGGPLRVLPATSGQFVCSPWPDCLGYTKSR